MERPCCPICLDEIEPCDAAVLGCAREGCAGEFHFRCAVSAAASSGSCPLCRRQATVEWALDFVRAQRDTLRERLQALTATEARATAVVFELQASDREDRRREEEVSRERAALLSLVDDERTRLVVQREVLEIERGKLRADAETERGRLRALEECLRHSAQRHLEEALARERLGLAEAALHERRISLDIIAASLSERAAACALVTEEYAQLRRQMQETRRVLNARSRDRSRTPRRRSPT